MHRFGERQSVEKRHLGRVILTMITVGVIKNGSTYLSAHLRKNDYWTEGEKEVRGEWIGGDAQRLGLEGAVDEKAFNRLRRNRHPKTNELLTMREYTNRVAFFDIQLSAPKDVSVLAMVGGDERVKEAFQESVKIALKEIERFAAVRERRGESVSTEDYRLTGNFVGALFFHDTSRDLDPQLHAHAVLGNATWDAERKQWMALQPAEMLRASIYVRQVLYREMAARLNALGYQTHDMNTHGFAVRGVEFLRERFSKRSHEVQKLAADFEKKEGRKPSKREVEIMVRESRGKKLPDVSTAEVRARQRAQLRDDEKAALTAVMSEARAYSQHQRPTYSVSEVEHVLEGALRHVYERASVARESQVLAAALEFNPDFDAWQALREKLEKHPDVICSHGEMTLRAIRKEEFAAIRRAQDGRNQYFPLSISPVLPESLTSGQRVAALSILTSRDFMMVLLGDAGTGKTATLSAIEQAHTFAGGRSFVPLAPTTRARDALVENGFPDADTVQRFLVSDALQKQAAGRVLLVDEAGLLSTQQLDQLTRIANQMSARMILVGDTKQHYSVERGDAFRNVVKYAKLPVVRLEEVLRQRNPADQRFGRMLANGNVIEAFEFAHARGMVREEENDHALFAKAAEHYVANKRRGIDTLVVIPFWEETDRFHAQVRPALRKAGLLGGDEVFRESLRPLAWTNEQKTHWNQYKIGDRLLFVRQTRFFKRGSSAEVLEVRPTGLRVRGQNGRVATITQKQRTAFDVGRREVLPLSVGERILIRGRSDSPHFKNGDFKEVASIDGANNRVMLNDGHELPADFSAWSYGHALTSYRAQGSSAEESLLVLGETSSRNISRRQFYVGNTRFRGAHAIYISSRADLLRHLKGDDAGRELATEFMARHRLSAAERMMPRYMQRMGTRMRHVWNAIINNAHRERQGERMDRNI